MKRHERGCKSKVDRPVQQHCMEDEIMPAEGTDSMTDASALPSSLDFTALDWLFTPQTPDSLDIAKRLEYLAYFTSARGMVTFLDRKTLEKRQKLMLDHAYGQNYEGESPPESSYADLLYDMECSDFLDTSLDIAAPHAVSEEPDSFLSKTQEIYQLLRSVVSNKQNTATITLSWTPSVQGQCSSFFTPRNIRRFIEYFWSLWYPNCPIVHRPLFDPQTAHPVLICVMVLIGACLSPHDDDGRDARMWMDCVEELVFSNAHHCEVHCDTIETAADQSQDGWMKERLECIQMTYLVCSLQKREGSSDAQTRIRRYRHAAMVTVSYRDARPSYTKQPQLIHGSLQGR